MKKMEQKERGRIEREAWAALLKATAAAHKRALETRIAGGNTAEANARADREYNRDPEVLAARRAYREATRGL